MMRDLRGFLEILEKRGDLIRIKEPVADGHEVFAILWELSYKKKSPVVVFEKVKDYKIPILANVFGQMDRFAMAARFPEAQGYRKYRDLFIERLTNKERWLKPVQVESGPVKQVILKGDEVNLYDLPIMQWHEHDGGPYITWPIEVTHDQKYGTNLGTYRMMIHNKNTTGLMCSVFQDIGAHFKRAKSRGESSLPCSVVIGADPALYLASVTKMPLADSEYEFAAALKGEAVRVVKSETNDILVPADAEIVLEGEISTTEVKEEGPFGEFMGYREEPMLLNVFKVNCITRRKDAYYMMTIEGPELGDAENVTSTSHNANFAVVAKERIIGYADSWLPGAGRAHMAVVSIKKGLPGWGKMAIYQAFSVPYVATMVNVVIVVDHDIDPSNNDQILWALATRVDPAQDIITTPYMGAYALNPAASRREYKFSRTGVTDVSMVSKLGIDATLKTPEEMRQRPMAETVRPQKEIYEKVLKNWKKYGFEH